MGSLLWLNEVPVTALSIPLITTFLFVLNILYIHICKVLQKGRLRESKMVPR